MIDIEQLTLGQIRELKQMFSDCAVPVGKPKTHSLPVGKKVFIRTVTMHYTGRIATITDYDLVLEDAAWIADSGRFANALQTGELSEVEPFPGAAIIPLGCIVDVSEWAHDLPREVR